MKLASHWTSVLAVQGLMPIKKNLNHLLFANIAEMYYILHGFLEYTTFQINILCLIIYSFGVKLHFRVQFFPYNKWLNVHHPCLK